MTRTDISDYLELEEMTDIEGDEDLSPVVEGAKLEWKRDVKRAAELLTESQARFLVDGYYNVQQRRIATAGQLRAQETDTPPNNLLLYFYQQEMETEKRVKASLTAYAKSKQIGRWLLSIHGIGGVLAAGLLAHIDIRRVQYAGQIWRFAGLDPTMIWGKGQKRPYNADLKVLCWKIGQSFLKVSGKEKAFYGQMYRQRKALEIERNEAGKNAETAKAILEAKRIGKETVAYSYLSAGKLPPGQIDARARRWAVKLFLSHFFETWYRLEYGKEPPMPFAIARLGHEESSYIPCPYPLP